jgi:PAS domain S-box-containing protein
MPNVNAIAIRLQSKRTLSEASLAFCLATVIALGVFSIDAFTPLDIAVAVFYVVVVLIVASSGSRLAVMVATIAVAVMTLVGFFLSHDDSYTGSSVARCVLSLLAIVSTSILSLRNLANTSQLHEQIDMLDLTHDAIVVSDLHGKIMFWNRGAEALYGWRADQALGQRLHELTQTRAALPLEEIHAELIKTGTWTGELHRVRHDGSDVIVMSRVSVWRDSKGAPRAILATNNDITLQKKMARALEEQQAALRRSEAFLIDAQRLSSTGSIGIGADGAAMIWSNEAYRIFGYDPAKEPVPALTLILERVHPEDRPGVETVFDFGNAQAPYIDMEYRLSMPDGDLKYVHFVAHRGPPASTELAYVGALMDVTAARRTQEALARSMAELTHATRLTTLGEMAASMAHEVTQPMAAVITSGDAALRWLGRSEPDLMEVSRSINQMIRSARRANDIVRHIRAMAQKRPAMFASVSLADIIDEATEMMGPEFQRNAVRCDVHYVPRNLYVCADSLQIHQVVINLLLNAVQAMAEVPGGARRIGISAAIVDERLVELSVEDSGAGIDEAIRERLFTPFVTTKANGIGMGLSICRSIIEAHGGCIALGESAGKGKGAKFLITLPLENAVEETGL